MKKLLVILNLLLIITCTACSKDEGESIELQEVDKVISEFDNSVDKILDKEYENLVIEAEDIKKPDITGIAEYRLELEEFNSLNTQERLALLRDNIVTGLLGEVDYSKLFSDYYDENNERYDIYYDAIINGEKDFELNTLVYKDDERFQRLETFGIISANYSAGKIGSIVNDNVLFSVYGYLDLVKTYEVGKDNLEDVYELLDGKKSVAEAIEEGEKYYDSLFPLVGDNNIKHKVSMVKVYKLKDTDYYVYNMDIRFSYKGLEIPNVINGTHVYEDENCDIVFAPVMKEAFMIESDRFDIHFGEMNNWKEPTFVREINKIISLEDAMDKVSVYLSSSSAKLYELSSISLKCMRYSHESGDGSKYLKPYWVVELYNTLDKKNYFIYIDVESGEIIYQEHSKE